VTMSFTLQLARVVTCAVLRGATTICSTFRDAKMCGCNINSEPTFSSNLGRFVVERRLNLSVSTSTADDITVDTDSDDCDDALLRVACALAP
jgi:hypothetical protein